MESFFNSNFFIALVTLVVGGFAIILYFIQRFNARRDATEVILGELRSAQEQLKKVQEHVARFQAENAPEIEIGLIPSNIVLMPQESWSNYKHIFTRRLDRHVYDAVSDFYEHARSYDQAVGYNNGAFVKNEESIRANTARMAMDIVRDRYKLAPKDFEGDKYEASVEMVTADIERINNVFMKQGVLSYSPRKPIQDARTELSILGNTDLSLAILKLKRMTWRRH